MELNSLQFYIVCALATLVVIYLITSLTRNRPSVYIETEGLRIDIEDCHLDEEKVADIISYVMLHHFNDPMLPKQMLNDGED
jgi:hypothetical protein